LTLFVGVQQNVHTPN